MACQEQRDLRSVCENLTSSWNCLSLRGPPPMVRDKKNSHASQFSLVQHKFSRTSQNHRTSSSSGLLPSSTMLEHLLYGTRHAAPSRASGPNTRELQPECLRPQARQRTQLSAPPLGVTASDWKNEQQAASNRGQLSRPQLAATGDRSLTTR